MIGKMVSLGFGLATMPARMTFKGARAAVSAPGDVGHFLDELRQVSDGVLQDAQLLLDSIDAEMSRKTAHLTPEQKQKAAEQALHTAERHLSVAAVNILQAVW